LIEHINAIKVFLFPYITIPHMEYIFSVFP